MTGLIPNECCDPPSAQLLPCRDARAVEVNTHCDHWYDDDGCCACGTQEPNLVIIDDGSEG